MRSFDSVPEIFRQLLANGGISFSLGPIKFQPINTDLEVVQKVINEVDDRRLFYNSLDKLIPSKVLESAKDAKSEIHKHRQVVFANPWKSMIAQLLHYIDEFITYCELAEHTGSFPTGPEDPRFRDFAYQVLLLRAKVWWIMAQFVVAFGKMVKPYHLNTGIDVPQEILQAAENAYSCVSS